MYQLDASTHTQLDGLPRVFVGSNPGDPAWIGPPTRSPLLEALLPAPLYQWRLDEAAAEKLTDTLMQTHELAAPASGSGSLIRMWELSPGEPRDLSAIFAPLDDAHISEMTIKDPYCAATDENRKSLVSFIDHIRGRASELEKISIQCRELNRTDERYKPGYKVHATLKSALNGCGVEIRVVPARDSKAFHDRTMDFRVISKDGCERTYRYDLTGGIDFLYKSERETKLFQYEIEL